jgi:hypothetical protein
LNPRELRDRHTVFRDFHAALAILSVERRFRFKVKGCDMLRGGGRESGFDTVLDAGSAQFLSTQVLN